MKIRRARPNDAEHIHRLAWQLGYCPDVETVKTNIDRMLAHSDYELVVATNDADEVIGWMSLAVRLRIEDTAFLQVAALVTDETVRGSGVGRMLMDYATDEANRRALFFIGLHSSKPRTDAHAFYEHIGYEKSKESFFFRKDLK